jgi:hypothetical protein
MKNRPVGADLFHADGEMDGRTDKQIDMSKLIVAFCNFASAPKNTIALLKKRRNHETLKSEQSVFGQIFEPDSSNYELENGIW